jgi:hypothetical protein
MTALTNNILNNPTVDHLESEREIHKLLNLPSELHKMRMVQKKVTYPKNINEYRHIIDTHKVKDSDLEWVLHLRQPRTSGGIRKTMGFQPPSFYNSDYQNYINKKKNDPNTKYNISNLATIEHLLKKRTGYSPDQTQMNFEINVLRDKQKFKKDWKNLPYNPRPIITPDFERPDKDKMKPAEWDLFWNKTWRNFDVKYGVYISVI